ncbi:MAG TPA: NUDIX domain-containing protein, partial [Arachnia sp.]|nr:NUDIX domain-containing protein [Arachnia sp.]
ELRLQVLHYPPLDLTVPARLKHSPLRRPVLRPWMGEVFDAAYAPDPATRADRLISPASAADTADLTGIAPAVVITAANDILREEGGRYAQRLREVGALVAHREIPGADHGYDGTDDALALASYRAIGADLSRALAGSPRPIRAASATILDEQGRVLLVLRGFEPGKGRWSVPGGRCEPEETLAETAAREVLEETGLQVEVGEELWAVVIPAGHGRVFEARNFAAKVTGGELTPGDDADDARWVADAELDSLPLTHDLAGHLRRAGVFSRD